MPGTYRISFSTLDNTNKKIPHGTHKIWMIQNNLHKGSYIPYIPFYVVYNIYSYAEIP